MKAKENSHTSYYQQSRKYLRAGTYGEAEAKAISFLLVCSLIEAAGQALIWLAPWSAVALTGAALTGFGYSLVYPGLGVEAVRRAPAQSQGLAMGTYTAFLDVALGFATPALGLIAGVAGLGTVFLVSMITAICAAGIAASLLYAPRVARPIGALGCPQQP